MQQFLEETSLEQFCTATEEDSSQYIERNIYGTFIQKKKKIRVKFFGFFLI